MSKKYLPVIIILAILLLDQTSKIWVKTHMMLSEEIYFTNWFRLHFTENIGMAFGLGLPGIWGKLFLSIFRLVAVTGGIWYLAKIVRVKAHWGFITAVSMILAGAIGNMIDGSFYGVIFSDSYNRVAQVFPPQGGYAGFMQGMVVDMLWFPLFHGYFPEWVPFVGGEYFEFFRFIFNIADAAITVGVAIIFVFNKSFFKEEEEVVTPEADTETAPAEQQVSNL